MPVQKNTTAPDRLKSMLKADFRRMFTQPLFYILFAIALVMPILIIVMTTMMDGSVSVDPNTGAETVIEGFSNTWQIIASKSSDSSSMSMDLTGMCNINLVYFMSGILACIFVSDEFRSGWAKNLFTCRAGKGEYVFSKTAVLFVCSALMLAAFVCGAVVGGGVSSLSFELESALGLLMCLLAKIFLSAVFVAIALLMSVIGKQKLWLSVLLTLGAGMLLFTMIPMMTPLDSSILNAVMCLAGGCLFAVGLGAVSKSILKKTDLIQ